jgi:hypothetical protein
MTPTDLALRALGSALEQAIYISAAVIFLAYVGRNVYRAWQIFLDASAENIWRF